METGRKKTVDTSTDPDTRHTLTQFGDWSGAQQTTIFRQRTGHCGLSAHLKRTGISDTSLCECGQDDQTIDHVLQSCPKYAERRQLTWPQGADLATKLWGSAEDLFRTAGFVASTGLKIRPARLSIAEEEEEEVPVQSLLSDLFLSTKTECDYINRWIKKRSHTQTSHPKPQRYSWGTQKEKKKKISFDNLQAL